MDNPLLVDQQNFTIDNYYGQKYNTYQNLRLCWAAFGYILSLRSLRVLNGHTAGAKNRYPNESPC